MIILKNPLQSITGRAFIASLLLVPALIAATGLGIYRAYEQSSLEAEQQQLTTWAYLLLAAADTQAGQLVMPKVFTEPRFSQPGSDLYAQVHADQKGTISAASLLWQSASARWLSSAELEPSGKIVLPAQVSSFDASRKNYFMLRYRVQWEQEQGQDLNLVFSLYHGKRAYNQSLAAFRSTLWRWLMAIAILVIGGLLVLVVWALRPLRGLNGQLQALNRGEVATISEHYAREIRPLVNNLNQLLAREQAGRERYRNALADLAHTIKTPLAVLRTELHQTRPDQALMLEQIQRLDDIVARQLIRAAIVHGAIVQQHDAATVAHRLALSLKKLFPKVNFSVPPEKIMLAIDEKDLFDMLGNIMENACKYGASELRISGGEDRYRGRSCRYLQVDDNGPGMDAHKRETILKRGQRADETQTGQGLGLGLVQEIVLAHGGELLLGTSELGGLSVHCRFPFDRETL